MGLDTTHGCFNGSYNGFDVWRKEICRLAGIEFDCKPRNRSTAELNGDWAETPDDILYVLIDHSDCDGHIPAQHCALLADRLVGLLPHAYTLRDKKNTSQFVKGLRAAAAKGEEVHFG